MARKKNQSGKRQAVGRDLDGDERLTTFSIRLNDEQRDLVQKAAALRGWTPTNLVRIAAVERAVHIINTSELNSTDLKGLASELAQSLFKERWVEYFLDQGELDAIGRGGPGDDQIHVNVAPLPLQTVFRLKRAADLGGGEFVQLLAAFAEGLTASQRTDLPGPVNPTAVLSKDGGR